MDVLEPLLDHIVTRSSQAKDATNDMGEVSFLFRGIAMAAKQKHEANLQGGAGALNAAEVQLEALHAKLNARIGLLPVPENVDIWVWKWSAYYDRVALVYLKGKDEHLKLAREPSFHIV